MGKRRSSGAIPKAPENAPGWLIGCLTSHGERIFSNEEALDEQGKAIKGMADEIEARVEKIINGQAKQVVTFKVVVKDFMLPIANGALLIWLATLTAKIAGGG